jgi:prepilin peptidase CpaA
MLSPPALAAPAQILLGTLTVIAAGFDIRYRRIPNWLVLTGSVFGFVWNIYSAGWPGLGHAATGFGAGFALYFPLYLLRARGAGDVKLLAAVGAIVGPGNCFYIFILTALLGGLVATIMLLFHKRVSHTFANLAGIMGDLLNLRLPYRRSAELDVTSAQGMRLPHGAIIAGGVAAFLAMAQVA